MSSGIWLGLLGLRSLGFGGSGFGDKISRVSGWRVRAWGKGVSRGRVRSHRLGVCFGIQGALSKGYSPP